MTERLWFHNPEQVTQRVRSLRVGMDSAPDPKAFLDEIEFRALGLNPHAQATREVMEALRVVRSDLTP